MARHDKSTVVKEGPLGWVFFTAYIGAVVHFYQTDPGFWGLILALLKGLVWPAYVVYEALRALGVS
jgi:hypothetical protein